MNAVEAYTETSPTEQTKAVSDSPQSASSGWAVLIAGIAAMVLIYIVTVYLPKIAAAVDRLLGRENKEAPPPKAEEYRVKDIYEGEKNLDDERYAAAYEFAARKHEGQFRIGGAPYITHPAAVADILREKGMDEEYLITALFHDLLEDTDATEEEIEALGGERVLRAVKLLTKKEGYVMSEYISGIKSDPIAYAVKGADRLHNLRSAFEADTAFRRRYIKESIEWYLDFCPEIPEAVKALCESIGEPFENLSS